MPREKTFDQFNVVKKATHLFWKYGFHQTSIQDLVKYLGINRASLYDTYGDKEGLFTICFKKYKQDQIKMVKTIFKENKNTKNGLRELFNFLLDGICTDPEKKGEFISNTLSEFIPKDSGINNHLKEAKEDALNILEEYLKEGQKNGYIKKNKNIKGVAHSIIATAIGSAMLSKIGSPNQKLKDNLFRNLDIILS